MYLGAISLTFYNPNPNPNPKALICEVEGIRLVWVSLNVLTRSRYERAVIIIIFYRGVYVKHGSIVREEDGQCHVVDDVLSGLVAVRVGHAGGGIQHAFVLDHGVRLPLGYGVKCLVRDRDIPYDAMRVVDGQRSGSIERIVDVSLSEVLDAVEVKDGLSTGVKDEATHLAAFFPRSSAIGLIFGPTGHELVDDVALEFVFELARESSSREVGLSLGGEVDHGVGVHVEDAGEQGMQPFAIQFDASVGRGEGCHGVGGGAQLTDVFLERMVGIDHLFAGGQNAVDVAFAIQEDVEEGLGVLTSGHLGLVGTLPEFPPGLLAINLPSVRRPSLRSILAGSRITPSRRRNSSRHSTGRAGYFSTSGGGKPSASCLTLIQVLM